jgi:hypothetical protein
MDIVRKARKLFKSLGGRVAGGYLRNLGYSLEDAAAILNLPHRKFKGY